MEKEYVVYEVKFGNVKYVENLAGGQSSGNSDWTSYKPNALRFTLAAARNLAKKFNKGLDAGVPPRFGWGT